MDDVATKIDSFYIYAFGWMNTNILYDKHSGSIEKSRQYHLH